MLRVILLAGLVALSACAEQHKLATCKGDLVALNPGHWQPSHEEMVALAKQCPVMETN